VINIASENCTKEGKTMDNSTYYLVNYFLPSLLTYLLTYLFTPWSTVLLEMLIVSQLVKKFSAIYGTRKFIQIFTNARHLSLS
jgi:hypothetical protein